MAERPREEQLVAVARYARRYFARQTHGQHDDISIGRELVRVLALYDDIEPTADVDRRLAAFDRAMDCGLSLNAFADKVAATGGHA